MIRRGVEMELVLGLNLHLNTSGLHLMDTGCALLDNKSIIAGVLEERVSRKKYLGGLKHSLPYVLSAGQIQFEDINVIAASVCTDVAPTEEYVKYFLAKHGYKVSPHQRIHIPKSHHTSHAMGAVVKSGFEDALVIVADGEGNIPEGQNLDKNFQANIIERTSYFLFRDNRLSLIEIDAPDPGGLGIGSAYEYMTEWLGFPNYQSAGKAMAIAAYGDESVFSMADLFKKNTDGQLICQMHPALNKSLAVRRFFYENTGMDVGLNYSESTLNPNSLQCDVAAYFQNQIEKNLVEKISNLLLKTKTRNVVFTGGVALNCVLNGKIVRGSDGANFYFDSTANDSGQSIGNCMDYFNHVQTDLSQHELFGITTEVFGKEYSFRQISSAVDMLKSKNNFLICEYTPETKINALVEYIRDKYIVAVFSGRSEMGPRALGNRSILCRADIVGIRDHLNQRVKMREYYRPYCISILEEKSMEYFGIEKSRNMNIVGQLNSKFSKEFKEIIHVDGTTRIQTLPEHSNIDLREILEKCFDSFGHPMLINTSFNGPGEPIVESPIDAIEAFSKLNIDVLSIGNYIIVKKCN
jgi:carbamoyltransferase